MNEGGSTFGGNQRGSGGTDAFDSSSLKISHTPSPEASANDIPITESVVVPTSDDGSAHLFGQEISGITDEDLSSVGTTQPTESIIFPNLTSDPTSNAETTPSPEASVTNPTETEIPPAPTQTPEPQPEPQPPQSQPPQPQETAPQTPVTPPPPPTQPIEPTPTPQPISAPMPSIETPPSDPYEQQFLQDLRNPKDTGDIILNSSASHKPKKGLIVGLIVGAITICLIGVFGFLFLSNNNSSTPTLTQTSEKPQTTAQKALEIYGEALADWDRTSTESTADLESLFNEFKSEASNDPSYSNISSLLEDYTNAFIIINRVSSLEPVTDAILLNNLLANGYDETLLYLEQIYTYDDEDDDQMQSYLNARLNYNLTSIEAFESAYSEGCIVNQVLDSICLDEVIESDPDLQAQIDKSYTEMQSAGSFVQDAYSSITASYQTILERTTEV